MSADDDQWHCCFCYESTSVALGGLLLDMTRPGHEARQTLAAHAACLAERLHAWVPFDIEAFAE